MSSIIEFSTEAEALEIAQKIMSIKTKKAVKAGYVVKDGILYGKSFKTGEVMLNKQGTVIWDEPKISPDNTYYITDNIALKLIDFGILGILSLYKKRKVMPMAWIEKFEGLNNV